MGNRRKDFLGFADIVAFREGSAPLLVQATSKDNVQSRIDKILASPLALRAARCGCEIVVHGWGKDEDDLRIVVVSLNEAGEALKSVG